MVCFIYSRCVPARGERVGHGMMIQGLGLRATYERLLQWDAVADEIERIQPESMAGIRSELRATIAKYESLLFSRGLILAQ